MLEVVMFFFYLVQFCIRFRLVHGFQALYDNHVCQHTRFA